MSDKGSNTKSQQENKGGTKAANVTLAMLLEEAWDSYLAAKQEGTPAQRSAALKAVYEQLLLQRKQDEGRTLDRFEMMDDGQLLAEVKRLLEKLSSTLGIKIEPTIHEE